MKNIVKVALIIMLTHSFSAQALKLTNGLKAGKGAQSTQQMKTLFAKAGQAADGIKTKLSMANLSKLNQKALKLLSENKITNVAKKNGLTVLTEIQKLNIAQMQKIKSMNPRQALDLIKRLKFTESSLSLFVNSKRYGWGDISLGSLTTITKDVGRLVKMGSKTSIDDAFIAKPRLKKALLNLSCT